jgi:hypothetical protein
MRPATLRRLRRIRGWLLPALLAVVVLLAFLDLPW